MHACPNQHLVPLLGYVVPRFGANGFLHRVELHLGLGDQPRRPRPDRRRRRQGAWRALSAARRDRCVAADRRDPGDAAGLHPQQSDRPVLLCLHRGLCRTRPRAIRISGRSAARSCPATSPNASCRRSARPATAIFRSGRISAIAADSSRADEHAPASSFEAAAYASVRVLAEDPRAQSRRALDRPARRPSPAATFRHAVRRHAIDPQTQHATLPVEIGRIEGDGFETVSRTHGRRARSLSVALRPRRDLRPPAPEGGVMSRASRIPNLGGAKAFVLHRPHPTVQAIIAPARRRSGSR